MYLFKQEITVIFFYFHLQTANKRTTTIAIILEQYIAKSNTIGWPSLLLNSYTFLSSQTAVCEIYNITLLRWRDVQSLKGASINHVDKQGEGEGRPNVNDAT